MGYADLVASCVVGGSSLAGYIREVHIRGSLCAPGAIGEIIVAADYPGTLQAGQSVTISLSGTLVFTGSVTEADRERPSNDIRVGIADEYLKVSRYFITDRLTTTKIESCSSLISQVLSGTGVTASVTAPDANAPAGTELGLRHSHEALQDILAYMSAYAYCDPDGTLTVKIIGTGTTHSFTSGIISFNHATTDEMSRNVIKVFGTNGIGPLGYGRVFAKAERDIGLTPDRTAAIGSGLIETQAEAQRVGNYLLSELGKIHDIVTAVVPGDPTVQIGHLCQFVYGSYSGTEVVTSLQHNLSDEGYETTITTGQRCPRISGWSRRTNPIYAGTSGSGIFRSTDGGINWTDFNTGLPAGNKYVRRVAANLYDQVMSIVNGNLYYHNGIQWFPITLPAPSNDAGDTPAPTSPGSLIAVTSGGIQGSFNVLACKKLTSGSAQQDGRTWVYQTSTSGSTWDSVELFDSSSTGSGWHVVGMDMTSRYGVPYVVATSGSMLFDYGVKLPINKIFFQFLDGPNGCNCIGVKRAGLEDYNVVGVSVSGVSPARVLSITVSMTVTVFNSGIGINNTTMYMLVRPGFDLLTDPGPFDPTSLPLGFAKSISISPPPAVGSYGTYTGQVVFQIDEATYGSIFSGRITFRGLGNANNCDNQVGSGDVECSPDMFLGILGGPKSRFLAGVFSYAFQD